MNEDSTSVTYKVPPTIEKFMKDDTRAVRLILGPWGSGKTTGCIMELLKRASEEYPDHKGIRKTRFVVVRNTSLPATPNRVGGHQEMAHSRS